MIQTEMVDGRIRHYSDAGYKIRQIETNILYEDAVDVLPCRYTYEETNEPVSEIFVETDRILNILLGEENGQFNITTSS